MEFQGLGAACCREPSGAEGAVFGAGGAKNGVLGGKTAPFVQNMHARGHFYPLGLCFYWLDWAPPYRPRSRWAGLASTLAEQVCSAERSFASQLAPDQCSLASAFPTSSQHSPAQPDPAQPSTAQPSALDRSIPLWLSSSRLSLAQLVLFAAQPSSVLAQGSGAGQRANTLSKRWTLAGVPQVQMK